MVQIRNYMVCTRCYTYNHSQFIKEALDGFSMQKTTFPVVTVIVDDASTDGEQEVIRQYLIDNFEKPYNVEETDYATTICACHKNNTNCEFVAILLKYNHFRIRRPKMPYLLKWYKNSKYYALCEGDDFWTDPNKLQRQVLFLENNPDFSMSFHDVSITSGHKYYTSPPKNFLTAKDIILRHYIPTASVVVRRSISEKTKEYGLSFGDIPFEIQVSLYGKVVFFPETMGEYRDNNSGSITHDKRQGIRGLKDSVRVYFFLLRDYPFTKYSIFLLYKFLRAIFLYPRNYVMLLKRNKSNLFEGVKS